MEERSESVKRIIHSLRHSVYDGVTVHIFGNLTGSIFLPAFALVLGASSFQIGVLAAIPFLATLAQLIGSFCVEKYQRRKSVTLLFSGLARGSWILIILPGFIFAENQFGLYLQILIPVVALYHILGSISGVAWLSWMSSLVPAEIRGRFFGLRNSLLGVITIVVTLSGGYFLDWFPKHFPKLSKISSFEILFMVGLVFGFISLYFLRKQHDPGTTQERKKLSEILSLFRHPWQQGNFRRFLKFAFLWSFAVNFTSPFFIVYMIKDLHLAYILIGTYTVISAVADLTGMGIWGHSSDRYGNRSIMVITTAVATVLPFFWIFTNTSPLSIYLFIPLLHLVGGFVWSGYNLCSVNMVFGIAPPERNSAYFAFWSIFNGLAAALGAIAGGFFSKYSYQLAQFLPVVNDSGFKLIFLISAMLRFFSLFILRTVREERGISVRRMVRILRSIKLWATMMGHHPIVQFFVTSENDKGITKQPSEYWPIWKSKRE
jgi:MFS family permease